MRRNASVRTIIAGLIVGLVLLTTVPAFALGVGGWEGLPLAPNANPALPGCMAWDNFGVQNACGDQENWIIPLKANAGGKSATVSVNNPGTGKFECALYAVTQSDGNETPSAPWYPNTGDQTKTMTVTVPPSGTMFLWCEIPPNGVIWSVNYNE